MKNESLEGKKRQLITQLPRLRKGEESEAIVPRSKKKKKKGGELPYPVENSSVQSLTEKKV